mmetsp:Transcript_30321/g.56838  ORF Transcript_30321/g.56838 Transcript_30321/m.56838 type:complete len:229 (+) Transcript_30321:479-1165(+)
MEWMESSMVSGCPGKRGEREPKRPSRSPIFALTLRRTEFLDLDLGDGDRGDRGDPPMWPKAVAFKLGWDVCRTTSLKDLGLLTVSGMEFMVLARLRALPKRKLELLGDLARTGELRAFLRSQTSAKPPEASSSSSSELDRVVSDCWLIACSNFLMMPLICGACSLFALRTMGLLSCASSALTCLSLGLNMAAVVAAFMRLIGWLTAGPLAIRWMTFGCITWPGTAMPR